MTATPLGEVRNVVLSVDDMRAARRFYNDVLGFTLRFQDGDRWTAYESGDFTIALAGGEEVGADRMAMSIKVPDVHAALERAVSGGATLVAEPATGAHEVRACLRDPDGHLLYLYSSL